MYLQVRTLVGENAMTLDDGKAIFQSIHEPLLHGEKVELDFDGVKVFASPFFNAGIGALLADLKAEDLRTNLHIVHISDFGSRVLRRVIDNAKEYYSSSPEQRNAASRIVEDTIKAM
ncbi:STAS-like domain-containing protein [Metapseudomonas boanensis]|uniref:STAS-like domain-containing protein n=1 Tax=Metapseudomonas boanensis TaxID=2822138 RepID=A0ABS5XIQ1_9GAMM|nr:STAS-like domain-containing protein [Pseudomonas boanensis]MBT8767563.1 STAS-like domain-containing protein [Pseudomonas boanensis]